ncbi:MAG: porphobilinogen synthase [Lentisphaerae bacterium]|jgi:porphobilinogen synthase|nr:porphobilinogen synthase [Lentisphaerota bacterium]
MNSFPDIRLRRLRQTTALRNMTNTPWPGPEKFIWPVFVRQGKGICEPLSSMPGQNRMSPDVLLQELAPVVASGISGILIFGLPEPELKDHCGTVACDPAGIVPETVQLVRTAFPNLIIATDVCLCASTTHGHCGPLDATGAVDNDATNELLAQVALAHAAAGAHLVAPSAMMDGQVGAIRNALDHSGHTNTAILAYSTKFASACYGPFREAENSTPQCGDRQGYQTSYRNPALALRESELDAAEGADILMVKPSLFYLDIISQLRATTKLPLAAYNVSGEYAMIIAAAERGWGNLNELVRESLFAISRAGADIIISYWANRYNEVFEI